MKILNGILKWLAVLAFSLSAGLLVIIFLSDQPQINAFLLRILILLAIGFIGGLFMRFLFRKGFAGILILVGLITNVLAVLVIDQLYLGQYCLVACYEIVFGKKCGRKNVSPCRKLRLC